jgi:hypothetical protein
MELGELQLNQLPKLSRYILPEDKNSDSILEINLHTMCNGQMDLGIILSRYDGRDDKEDAARVINAMKCMAMVYEELNDIKYEILKMLYSK